jgi:EmrB/QacA subfamily drug resistance transporter
VVCLALAAVVAAMASLNTALPSIARDTHAGQTELEWVIDAYSLAFASLLLPAGALGDRYGRRLALIAGLVVFGGGSLVAMTASGAHELIGLRALIGIGAALVMPATLSTITSTFPEAQRVRAVGVWAAVAGGAAILGLLVSGTLLEFWGWQSVFAVNVVLAAAAAIGVVRFVPESADPDAPPIDVGGAAISVLGLGLVVFSVIEAPDHGWTALRTVAGIGGGLAILAGFVAWELRQAHPLLDPRVFRHPRLAAGSFSVFAQFFAFFGFTFVVLQYLQLLRGYSPLEGSLSVLPMAAAMIPTARLAPELAGRLGSRRVCVAGLLLVGAGLASIAQVDAASSYWQLAAGLVVLGIGMGAAMTPATTWITESLPPAQQGVASALNDLSREVGGAIGIAVIGSLLAAGYRSSIDGAGLPGPVAEKARISLAVASRMGDPVAAQAQGAFVDGMHSALLFAAGVAVVAAVAVAGLLRHGAGRPAAASARTAAAPTAR